MIQGCLSHLTFALGLYAPLYDMLSGEGDMFATLNVANMDIDPLSLAFATMFFYATYLVEHEEIVQTWPNDLLIF